MSLRTPCDFSSLSFFSPFMTLLYEEAKAQSGSCEVWFSFPRKVLEFLLTVRTCEKAQATSEKVGERKTRARASEQSWLSKISWAVFCGWCDCHYFSGYVPPYVMRCDEAYLLLSTAALSSKHCNS